MRARIERDDIRAALARVRPAVARGSVSLPALRCVLISASDAGLSFTACDIDSRISTVVDIGVHVEGSVLVPHERLSQLVGKAQAGAIDLAMVKHELEVTANGGRLVAKLNTVDVADFPRWTNATGDPVQFGADWLAVTNVVHARSRDDARPNLTHVVLGHGWAYATDSYRLARQPIAYQNDGEVLLAGAVVEAVAKSVDDGAGLTLTMDGQRFDLEHEGTTWSGHLLNADPPAWSTIESMYDRACGIAVTIGREALADAVVAIGAIGLTEQTAADGHKFTTSIAHLAASDGAEALTVAGKHSDHGHVTVDVSAAVVGGDVDIKFNGGFLLDALKVCESDTVTLNLTDGFKPCSIVDDELELLVMPTK